MFLTVIPNEIHYVILKNLSVRDILQVSQVCKETKEMVDDNTIWKSVFQNPRAFLTFQSSTESNFYMVLMTTLSLNTILATLTGEKCTKRELLLKRSTCQRSSKTYPRRSTTRLFFQFPAMIGDLSSEKASF
jgi:hypothetical protein